MLNFTRCFFPHNTKETIMIRTYKIDFGYSQCEVLIHQVLNRFKTLLQSESASFATYDLHFSTCLVLHLKYSKFDTMYYSRKLNTIALYTIMHFIISIIFYQMYYSFLPLDSGRVNTIKQLINDYFILTFIFKKGGFVRKQNSIFNSLNKRKNL